MDEAATADLVALQSDITSIAAQISTYRESQTGRRQPLPAAPIANLGIPTVMKPYGEMDYAVATSEPILSKSGIVAVLSQKDLLDIPAIMSSARHFIYFAGYSQRSLFRNEKNAEALETAINRGAIIRILLSDPNSQAAALRSKDPAYSTPSDLINDIQKTIALGRRFFDALRKNKTKHRLVDRFEIPISKRVPPCSYFIVDDLRYMSLYSLRLTGSRGPCLALKAFGSTLNSYYYILKQDFLYSFSEASRAPGWQTK